MSYRLQKLAAGSYDVLLNGRVIASLVRETVHSAAGRYRWTAELLVDGDPGTRPAPFTQADHRFSSLEEAYAWLGIDLKAVLT